MALDAALWLLDFLSGEPLYNPRGTGNDARFSADASRVVSASEDWSARVWDVHTGTPKTPKMLHNNLVSAAVFGPNGRLGATSAFDHSVRLWDVQTGEPISEPLRHTYPEVGWVRFSDDGSSLFSSESEQAIRWPIALAPQGRQRQAMEATLLSGIHINEIGLAEALTVRQIQWLWKAYGEPRLAPLQRGKVR